MPQTFVFEELDEATRSYLIAVRDGEGAGAPGLFAPVSSAMAGCGCIAGPIIIGLTLALTLTSWILDVVYDDPVRIALLQTAGILIGGWLLFAGIRSAGMKGSKKMAGNWVYIDPLHLYQGYREQVKITRVDDAVEANFTHNYNNGAYQNSVVRVVLSGNAVAQVTINNEQRAEQMKVFVDYLAWARSPEGGERASLAPASLGGLAKYVAKNDVEPKDSEGNINLNLVELDITQVPEEPVREGRALPSIFPYIVMIAGGVGVFYLMAYIINPPIRDDAIFEAVIKEPCEPWYLRAYLMDERNTRHRDVVLKRLAKEYDETIAQLTPKQPDTLRDGMIKLLESLKVPEFPTVSLKVTENGGKPGAEERVTKLRDGLVGKIEAHRVDPGAKDPDYFTAEGGIVGELARIKPAVQAPAGMTFPKPRTAVGIQLIDFAKMPEDAKHAHFEITYQFAPSPINAKLFELTGQVEIRTSVDGDPVAVYKDEGGRIVEEKDFNAELDRLQDRLLLGLVGKGQAPIQVPVGPPPK